MPSSSRSRDPGRAAAVEVAQTLGGDVSSLRRFAQGSSSSVWALTTPSVVLIVDTAGASEDALRARLRLAAWLASHLPFVQPESGTDQPLRTRNGLAVTVWQRVPTQPGPPDWEAAGAAVAQLHALEPSDVPDGVRLAEADDLGDVRRLLDELRVSRRSGGGVADLLLRVTERLEHELAALPRRRRVVHGDLHRHNLLATPRSVVLCDTDEIAVADPGWDLGFLVDPGRPTLTAADRDAFVRGYGSALPAPAAARTVARAAHLRRTVRQFSGPPALRDRYWNRVRLGGWARMLADWDLDLQPAVAQPRRRQLGLAASSVHLTSGRPPGAAS